MSVRRIVSAVAAGAALTAVAAVSASPASAAGPKLTLIGVGTSASTSDGGASYAATLSGSPIAGESSGEVHALDGSLPQVGDCEPATATLRVQNDRGAFVSLPSTGEVCALYLPLGTMQRFTGTWNVDDSSLRRLLHSNGVIDVRLMNGQSDIYATS